MARRSSRNRRSRGGRGSSRRSSRRSGRGGRGGSYTGMYSMAGVLVLAVASAFGWMVFRPMQGETQQAACAILVDRTGSSINEETRASYMELASRMVDGCRDRQASMAVYYFDNQNAKLQTMSPAPFALWQPKAHRQSTGEAKVAEAMQSALTAVSGVFETATADSQGGHGSDIVTALHLASQSLQQQADVEGVEQKYLVVLTDGYQTGKLATKRGSDVAALMTMVQEYGLIPDLAGVDVSFGGVGGGVASTRQQVSQERENLVHNFWTSLVEAGGGGLCVYNVEPAYLPGSC